MTIASLRSDRNFPCALWLPTGYPFESGRPVAAAFSRQGWWTAGTMATRPGRGGTADRRPVGVGLTTRLRGRGRPPVGEPASREPLALRDLAQRARERRPNRDRRRWSPAKAGGACVMRVAMPRDLLTCPGRPFQAFGWVGQGGDGSSPPGGRTGKSLPVHAYRSHGGAGLLRPAIARVGASRHRSTFESSRL